MIAFFILAATLIAVALAVVLLPLMRRSRGGEGLSRSAVNVGVYRDQLRELEADLAAGTIDDTRYDEARREIERRLLEDADAEVPGAASSPRRGRATAAVAAIAIPIAAVALYLAVGNPAALDRARLAGQGAEITPEQVASMAEMIASRLEANPDDAQGWTMLGRAYTALGRFKEAADAYGKAVALVSGDAQLLVDYADALAMAQGRNLAGEPEALIQRALAIDPHHPKALALAGTAAFHKRQYKDAVAYWERLLAVVPPESEAARAVQGSIAEAQALGGLGAPAPRADAAKKPQTGESASAQVSGLVRIAPELAQRVAPGDTVFIFARAADGPRMPLAIQKRKAGDFPITFVLDENMAMAPGMSLSSFERVVIGARVSRSGNAAPSSGDLEGASAPVKVGATDVSVVIDKIVQ